MKCICCIQREYLPDERGYPLDILHDTLYIYSRYTTYILGHIGGIMYRYRCGIHDYIEWINGTWQRLHNLGCYAPYVGRTLPVCHRSYMEPITLADDISPILFTASSVLSNRDSELDQGRCHQALFQPGWVGQKKKEVTCQTAVKWKQHAICLAHLGTARTRGGVHHKPNTLLVVVNAAVVQIL